MRTSARPDVAGFFRQLLLQIPGPLIVVWDNSVTHRGKLIRELEQKRDRLHIEYFPAYAPELNPDEGVWSQLKGLLANGRPDVTTFSTSRIIFSPVSPISDHPSQSSVPASTSQTSPLF
jgi:transposase